MSTRITPSVCRPVPPPLLLFAAFLSLPRSRSPVVAAGPSLFVASSHPLPAPPLGFSAPALPLFSPSWPVSSPSPGNVPSSARPTSRWPPPPPRVSTPPSLAAMLGFITAAESTAMGLPASAMLPLRRQPPWELWQPLTEVCRVVALPLPQTVPHRDRVPTNRRGILTNALEAPRHRSLSPAALM